MEQIPELCNEWHHTMREYKKMGNIMVVEWFFFVVLPNRIQIFHRF